MSNKLREAREKYGMSVSELARRSGVSRQTITNIELHGQVPSSKTAFIIAKTLKLDPRDIFFTNDVIHGLQKEKEQVI